jgi:septal ring factor EnvC (AmiA/AmiB activator)
VSKVVEPKRKKLAEAEAQLDAANNQLKEKQDALAAVVQRVDTLKQQLADAESEQRQLSAQVRDVYSSVSLITWYIGLKSAAFLACALHQGPSIL